MGISKMVWPAQKQKQKWSPKAWFPNFNYQIVFRSWEALYKTSASNS